MLKQLIDCQEIMLKGLSSILKKAVQVAAPLIGAATPLGPIFGAAAGSGLASLLQGQKPEQALRSAALSGLAGFGADKLGLLGKGTAVTQTGGSNTQRIFPKDLKSSFLSNLKIPALTKTLTDNSTGLTGFGTGLAVGLPSVLAYMGAAADAKRTQPMDPADYMSATDKFYGGQFARPP